MWLLSEDVALFKFNFINFNFILAKVNTDCMYIGQDSSHLFVGVHSVVIKFNSIILFVKKCLKYRNETCSLLFASITKFDNSDMHFDEIMPLFQLIKYWLRSL